jgi:hypothetical protein
MYRQDCCKHKVLSDKKKSLVSYYKEYLWHIEDVYIIKKELSLMDNKQPNRRKIRLDFATALLVQWSGTQLAHNVMINCFLLRISKKAQIVNQLQEKPPVYARKTDNALSRKK